MKKKKVSQGFAVIVIVGAISLLMLIALYYSFGMKIEAQLTENYSASIKAEYLSQMAISRALAELKYSQEGAVVNFSDTLDEQWASGFSETNLFDSKGEYEVKIQDCTRYINVNDCNNPNLVSILSHLPAMDTDKATALIVYRDSLPLGRFESKQEILLVPEIDENTYTNIKDCISIYGYQDPNCCGRSPVNVNTVSFEVLKALLWELSEGGESISESEAEAVAIKLIADRPHKGQFKWHNILDTLAESVAENTINTAEAQLIFNNFNPNKDKPSIFSTEFCFNSGGYYIFEAVGIYKDNSTQKVSKKKVVAVVKIFDMHNQTTKEDFRQSWINDSILLGDGTSGDEADGEIVKVSFYDSCPVRSDEEYTSTYTIIKNSLKSGFWDNFEEDIEFTNDEWNILSGSWHIEDGMMSSSGSMNYHPKIDLGNVGLQKWNWDNHSINVCIDDRLTVYQTHAETGWWMFGWPTGLPAYEDIRLTVSRLIFRYNNDSATGNGSFKAGDCGDLSNSPNPADHTNPGNPPYSSPPADKKESYLHAWIPDINFINEDSYDYELMKTMRVSLEDSLTNSTRWYLYLNGIEQATGLSGNLPEEGICRIYGYYHQPAFDNVRIIPEEGHYISTPFNVSEVVEWGAMDAAVTIPETADIDSEKINFELSIDAGYTWINVAADQGVSLPAANSIQYKAVFKTDDTYLLGSAPYYNETAVLEDIWIIYLKETQILYWSGCYE